MSIDDALYYGVSNAAAAVSAPASSADAAVLSAEAGALLGALRAVADASDSPVLRGIVWTKPLCRVLVLVARCLAHSEPVLLVGETGTGDYRLLLFYYCFETQLIVSILQEKRLFVNCLLLFVVKLCTLSIGRSHL